MQQLQTMSLRMVGKVADVHLTATFGEHQYQRDLSETLMLKIECSEKASTSAANA